MSFSGTVTSDFLKYIPAELDNKEKLIDYSASDFESLRQALINYAKATFPLDYNHFSESDFGILLIELMAAVGHIQSMKSDYLANENFLRTARNRFSVKKLLELVGVRMKGPIAAAANASIIVNVPGDVTNVYIVTLSPENRVFTITSPEDGGVVTYTLYKVNSDGSIDLQSLSNSLSFTTTHTSATTITLSNAILLEGSLVIESGTFQSPDVIKSITLSQFPYIEKSAQVFVEGSPATAGVYFEEENIFFASGSSDKVFQITTDDSYKASILFGDSTIGLSPAVGDSYTISYRIGGGERGNIGREVINVPTNCLLTYDIDGSGGPGISPAAATVENSGPGTGGAEAETVQHAKRYAPLTFRRQDRLVTVADYKSFVNSFISNYGSTGKANAVVRRAYSSANIIDIFTLEKASNVQLRKATPEYKRQLLLAIQEKKMLTDEPVVVDGLIRTLDLVVTVRCDQKYKNKEESIKNKVRDRVLNYFNVDNADFGEQFIPQDLVRYLLELTETRYATVDNVDSTIRVDFNEIIQLNNLTINISFI